jgi:hypothetical protein
LAHPRIGRKINRISGHPVPIILKSGQVNMARDIGRNSFHANIVTHGVIELRD